MVIPLEQEEPAKHGFERTEETLNKVIHELSDNNFGLTVNRSYYPVSYAMRVFLAIIGKDSSFEIS